MKNKIISLFLLVLLSLTVISCSHDVIFHDIANEVKLVNPEINGNVYSIVPLNGKLYVENGSIYEKANPGSAHGWTNFSKPAGSSIIRLASDADTLYAMDTNFDVYANQYSTSWSGWTKVASGVLALFDNQVMDNTAFTTTGRAAYITAGDESVKKLNGTGTPSAETATDTFAATNDYIKAAASTDNGATTVFSSNSIFCAQGTNLYSIDYGNTTIRYSTNDGSTWTNGGSVDATAMSICPYGANLLIGTVDGYQISALSSAIPSSGYNSSTNAESLISNNRQIITIKAFGSAVYAGVISETSTQYSKLWGYFGISWNYE